MQSFEIKEPYFSFIKNGPKKYEGRRANHRMITNHKRGDIIEIRNGDSSFLVKIVDYEGPFCSAREMLQIKGVTEMLPDVFDLEIGVDKYVNQFNCKGQCYAIKLELV